MSLKTNSNFRFSALITIFIDLYYFKLKIREVYLICQHRTQGEYHNIIKAQNNISLRSHSKKKKKKLEKLDGDQGCPFQRGLNYKLIISFPPKCLFSVL